jgi:hypothetical protein
VGNASIEDLAHVISMNRLRAAYAELDPGVERYFVTSAHDDDRGLWQTYNPLVGPHQMSNVLASSGTFITVVTSGITGAFVALIAVALGAPGGVVGVVGVAAGMAFLVGSVLLGSRSFRRLTGRTVMFPSTGAGK